MAQVIYLLPDAIYAQLAHTKTFLTTRNVRNVNRFHRRLSQGPSISFSAFVNQDTTLLELCQQMFRATSVKKASIALATKLDSHVGLAPFL